MTQGGGGSGSAVSLPQGGGALQGIGETFQPDLFSGTGDVSVPIATSPGREGFGPELSLRYSSGSGNGPFGLGWRLTLPSVTRKTEKGLPRYDARDVFVLSGAEELVRCLAEVDDPDDPTGTMWRPDTPVRRGPYHCHRYRPRTEGLFARIERWVGDAGDVHWRATTRDNVTSVYGRTAAARVADPADPSRVFEWLLEETFDARGHHVHYEYAAEDPRLAVDAIFERNRVYGGRYPRRIFYGVTDRPVGPVRRGTDHADPTATRDRHYLFEVAFDYGDAPSPSTGASSGQEIAGAGWSLRPDPFSSYRAGFERRTLRRCGRVLMIHHFEELGAGGALVRSTDFGYDEDPATGISFLTSVTLTGHRRQGGASTSASLPPVTFGYSRFEPHRQRFETLTARGDDLPTSSLRDPDLTLVDLSGNGLPDLLETRAGAFRRWRNLGGGRFDRPHPMHRAPAGVTLSRPGVGFADLGGDGRADLLVLEGPVQGYYETADDAGWHPFRAFARRPSLDPGDPNVRLLDLTGDGLADILVARDHHLLWYRCLGEDGYADAEAVERVRDLDAFPDVAFDDPAERVRLADMTGDGLEDIVFVHDGRVEYWPNLGYGRFGRRVTMAHAPRLGIDFAPARLFLVDLDGSGCADLVYVENGRVRFWFNRSGNAWSEEQTIHGTPAVTDRTALSFTDIYGTGTTCLLWSDVAGTVVGTHYRALDFCGGVKPYLLTIVDNNLGATTRVRYAPSTKYALEDEAMGEPWSTRLPFPVQVVDKVEVIDHLGGTKLVTRYSYHHGYFDGREREFRGFGRVDRYDTESFDAFEKSDLHADPFANRREEHHLPPVLTRTWFHTGAFLEHQVLTERYRREFYAGDDRALAPGPHDVRDAATPHEAYRALRGALLRQEVYALDGSAGEPHPYSVTESSFQVRALQPRGENAHAVLLRTPKCTLTHHYERNPDDPRVSQTLTLPADAAGNLTDAFGNVTDTVTIAYPRRPGPDRHPVQASLKALYTKTEVVNRADDPALYYAGVPCQTRSYEIHGLAWPGTDGVRPLGATDLAAVTADPDDHLPYQALPATPPSALEKRLVAWTRSYFRRDGAAADLGASARLDLFEIDALGLPFESYRAALTDALVDDLYGRDANDRPRVDAAALAAAGYHPEPAGTWWIPSGRQAFDPERFYLPVGARDPFGAESTFGYDRYALLLERTTDPLGNEVLVEALDYRVLQPATVRDPNHNRTDVAFDTLGFVVGTAVRGKHGEGDTLQGFDADLQGAAVRALFADPLGAAPGGAPPHALLGGATTRVVYDLHRFRDLGEPAGACTLTRETHAADLRPDGPPGRVQPGFLYSDGFGREIQRKVRAEPDVAGAGAPRWVGSGWTVFDNKGNPVRQFEPFFTTSHRFQREVDARHGVSATLFYDPAGRVVATLHPDHSFEKVVFDAWRQEHWDANDTVLLDPRTDPDVGGRLARFVATLDGPGAPFRTWHQARRDAADPAERDAAAKTAAHAATPTVVHLDALGRTFLTVETNRSDGGTDEPILTHTHLDIEGNDLAITDPRGLVAFRHRFDLAGRKLTVDSVDAGHRRTLLDALGDPVLSWDAAGRKLEARYDALRRPTHLLLHDAPHNGHNGASPTLLERTVYGEAHPDSAAPDAGTLNLRGKVFLTLDGAGVVVSGDAGLQQAFDFKGNPLATSRQFARMHDRAPDWSAVEGLLGATPLDPAAIDAALAPLLEAETFTTTTRYDALDRVRESAAPDGSVFRPRYNEANLLEALDVRLRGASDPASGEPAFTPFITAVDTDARGQRLRVDYGNGVHTRYRYDPATFRLVSLVSERATGGRTFQDLRYHYDPRGNLTRQRDDAQQTLYFANAVVKPESDYRYDALYRLVSASGREHAGQAGAGAPLAPHYDPHDAPRTGLPHPGDGQGLRRYTREYRYDASGNLAAVSHRAGAGGWTREHHTDPASNRLRSTRLPGDPPDTLAADLPTRYPHDPNGNLTATPHLSELSWDHHDRLVRVDLGGGGSAHYRYDGGGGRVRKVVERGAVREERLYLGSLEIYRRYGVAPDGSATLERERQTLHVMDGSERVALVETLTHDAGSPVEGPAPVVRYGLADHLGSSSVELDASGQVLGYEAYYPYGGAALQQQASGPGLGRKRYRYAGKERDEETGMDYYGARYSLPWLGRWASADPLGPADSLNLYTLLLDNPLTHRDPSGTSTEGAQKVYQENPQGEMFLTTDPVLAEQINQLTDYAYNRHVFDPERGKVDLPVVSSEDGGPAPKGVFVLRYSEEKSAKVPNLIVVGGYELEHAFDTYYIAPEHHLVDKEGKSTFIPAQIEYLGTSYGPPDFLDVLQMAADVTVVGGVAKVGVKGLVFAGSKLAAARAAGRTATQASARASGLVFYRRMSFEEAKLTLKQGSLQTSRHYPRTWVSTNKHYVYNYPRHVGKGNYDVVLRFELQQGSEGALFRAGNLADLERGAQTLGVHARNVKNLRFKSIEVFSTQPTMLNHMRGAAKGAAGRLRSPYGFQYSAPPGQMRLRPSQWWYD